MRIIIGLGNPGEKYKETRHNIGFKIIDEFGKKNSFPKFRLSKKTNSLISKKEINGEEILLSKPQTFMNDSGRAVKKLVSHFKFHVSSLIVVHDDIDLLLGKIKIVKNRGSAGHKGVESIIKELGSKNFIRIRVGILPQKNKPKDTKKFVLERFTKEEKEVIEKVIKKTTLALLTLIEKDLEKTMSIYNK